MQVSLKIKSYASRTIRHLLTELSWKSKAQSLSKRPCGLQIHLGCGSDLLPDMLNCEFRATLGVDKVMDCSRLTCFRDETVTAIYSHAFFEHLYRDQHLPFLRDACRVLGDNGFMVTIGIPDFREVARQYLVGGPGVTRPKFDLFEAYRYTHGDPEHARSWWLQQLHKSLFDFELCNELWTTAGFKQVHLFNYTYTGEHIPLNIGVIATKQARSVDAHAMLSPFSNRFADFNAVCKQVNQPVG